METALKETGKFIFTEAGKFDIRQAEEKGKNDFVSYVDKGSEEMLVQKLSLIMPEAGFITEEGTSTKEAPEYYWIIDPLDGTTNFLHRLPPYAISVALVKNNETVAGVVLEVTNNELFSAWKGGGSWLNGNPIYVSKPVLLADSLIGTGIPCIDFSRLENYFNTLKQLSRRTHGIRRFGAASVDLCYVATGRYDGFFEYSLKRWDVAAGILIVREAGGRVSDFSGNEKNLTGSEIIASNNIIFPEFFEIVSKFMKD